MNSTLLISVARPKEVDIKRARGRGGAIAFATSQPTSSGIKMKTTRIFVTLAALFVFGRVDCGDPWGENLQPRLRANFLSQKSGKARTRFC